MAFQGCGWGCWFRCLVCCLFSMGCWAVEYIHVWNWYSETVELKMKRKSLDEMKIYFLFSKSSMFRFANFCKSSESLAAESFWYPSIVSHPASDLSAILINLFLFFSLSLMGVEEWADSVSLLQTWWTDSWMSSKISTVKLNCFFVPNSFEILFSFSLSLFKKGVPNFQLAGFACYGICYQNTWALTQERRLVAIPLHSLAVFVCLFGPPPEIPEFINCFSKDHFDNMYVIFFFWYKIARSILIKLWRFQTKQYLIYLAHVTECLCLCAWFLLDF